MRHCRASVLVLGAGLVVGCPDATDREPPPADGTDTNPFDFTTTGTSGGIKLDIGDGTSPFPTGMPPEFTDGGCAEVQVQVDPIIPTLVLLVDQSGSMTSNFAGQERWDAIYETLMDPTDGVVTTLGSQVRFGLTLYTSENGNEGGECPLLTGVEPALDNFEAIDGVFAPANPGDETPTGESLAAVAEQLAAFQADGPKGIVLATDGEPDTCEQPNPQEGQPESLAAAELAFSLGITTYIISVGDDVGADHLQEMANVGVGKAPDDAMPAPYYQALDAMQLVDAFEEIIGNFVSCELLIEGEVDLEQACEGTVLLDGVELECGVDWDITSPTTLELMGAACATLQDGGDHMVDASWPCGAINIP